MDRVLERLEGVSENGAGFVAKCPVPGHGKGLGDQNPSLSVSEGEAGKALLHCHAGCAVEDVVAAAGISMEDLFAYPGQNGAKRRSSPEVSVISSKAGSPATDP